MWGEVNALSIYTAPWELPSGLRVLDLGGHVGYFARWALEWWPVESLVSVEADPGNGEVLDRNHQALADPRWRLLHAAAMTYDGMVSFAGGRGAGSGIGDDGADRVPTVDALKLLGECDLAKIDIEGSEWPLLSDPRFADCAPPLLVLEYHPVAGVIDAAGQARMLLQAAGYELIEVHNEAPGVGTLWARRQRRHDQLSRANGRQPGQHRGEETG